jgi:alpha-beta hydrolase superfamily lysophospholipase
VELTVDAGGATLAATLSVPDGEPRAGVVALHPAREPSRHQTLLAHLAQFLPSLGIALLRHDRRPSPPDVEITVAQQAADAGAVAAALRAAVERPELPLGVWGASMGGRPALQVAAWLRCAFCVIVGGSSLTAAATMRHGTARLVREAGHGDGELLELAALRGAWEDYQRGVLERAAMAATVETAAAKPWFPLALVPRALPPPGSWEDMDSDPAEEIAAVRCPTLLVMGEDDEWVPAARSTARWRELARAPLTVVELPGAPHLPLAGPGVVDPSYERALGAWLSERLAEV